MPFAFLVDQVSKPSLSRNVHFESENATGLIFISDVSGARPALLWLKYPQWIPPTLFRFDSTWPLADHQPFSIPWQLWFWPQVLNLEPLWTLRESLTVASVEEVKSTHKCFETSAQFLSRCKKQNGNKIFANFRKMSGKNKKQKKKANNRELYCDIWLSPRTTGQIFRTFAEVRELVKGNSIRKIFLLV